MNIPPPPEFKAKYKNEKAGQSWKEWKQLFQVYLSATDLEEVNGKGKVSLLLHFLGPDRIKLYTAFDVRPAAEANSDSNIVGVPAEDKYNLETVLLKFDQHYGNGKLPNIRRKESLGRNRHTHESLMNFIADLKKKILMCEYGEVEESLLCDRIVEGIQNTHQA